MQELVGRLTALDPEATESLKVIAYFDALVEGHANWEVLLRGAAVLSGCAVGYAADGALRRVDSSGARSSAAVDSTDWPSHSIAGGGRAWLERAGDSHANDAMILERLAIALGILIERSAPIARKAVETLLDATESNEQHAAAASRLRLDSNARYRVVASPASAAAGPGNSAVLATAVGAVRASIVATDPLALPARAGVGSAETPATLGLSWTSALLALRLTSQSSPVLMADDLGAVLLLAGAADAAAADSQDLAAIRRATSLSPKTLAVLESIVATDSLRAAAAEVGIHHSTMQARAAELSTVIGFDLRTVHGRTRLSLALSLYNLATNRFE